MPISSKKCDHLCILLDTLPAVDGRIDGQNWYIIASYVHGMLTRDKHQANICKFWRRKLVQRVRAAEPVLCPYNTLASKPVMFLYLH